jgi:pimeloyl-ACP methyl ester carboxylesterase
MRTRNWIGLASAVGSAAVVGGAYMRYRQDLKERSRALEAKSKVVSTRNGTIEYAREGKGPAALVIHGAGGGYDQGLFLGHEMLGDDYDIIAPSRFGYLGTPLPRNASIAAQADAHAALLAKLGVSQAVILGVSAGAPSAIELAVRHPDRVRALILVVPRAFDPENQVGVDETPQNKAVIRLLEGSADFTYWLSTRVARKPLVRFFGVEPGLEAKAPREEREKITAVIHDMLPLSARVAGLQNDTATDVTESNLEDIDAPTLIISAEDDLYHTLPGARYTAEHIPDAELKVYESGGHLLVSRGHEVRTAIADFIQERVDPVPKPVAKTAKPRPAAVAVH